MDVDLAPIMAKRLTLTGSTLRASAVDFKGTIAAELRDQVQRLLEDNQVESVLHATYPLTSSCSRQLDDWFAIQFCCKTPAVTASA